MSNFRQQVRSNLVALISLAFAVATLSYTSWRMEQSEANQNARAAGFEILMQLGELQLNVDYAHYGMDADKGNPISGWTRVIMIRDLAKILGGEMPAKADALYESWSANWDQLESSRSHTETITAAIEMARQACVDSLARLD